MVVVGGELMAAELDGVHFELASLGSELLRGVDDAAERAVSSEMAPASLRRLEPD